MTLLAGLFHFVFKFCQKPSSSQLNNLHITVSNMYFLSAICVLAATVSQVVTATPVPAVPSSDSLPARNLDFDVQYGEIVAGRDFCVKVCGSSSIPSNMTDHSYFVRCFSHSIYFKPFITTKSVCLKFRFYRLVFPKVVILP